MNIRCKKTIKILFISLLLFVLINAFETIEVKADAAYCLCRESGFWGREWSTDAASGCTAEDEPGNTACTTKCRTEAAAFAPPAVDPTTSVQGLCKTDARPASAALGEACTPAVCTGSGCESGKCMCTSPMVGGALVCALIGGSGGYCPHGDSDCSSGDCAGGKCVCLDHTCHLKGSPDTPCQTNADCDKGDCAGGNCLCSDLGGGTKKCERKSLAEARALEQSRLPVSWTSPLGTITSPGKLIGRIVKTVLGVIGAIALLMFVYGGIMWMTSGGSPEKIKKAQTTLVWATLGLAVIFASYAIVDFVLKSLGV